MSIPRREIRPLSRPATALLIIGAGACFHLAYSSETFGVMRLLIVGWVVCLAQLSRLKTTRQSFYAGLLAGFICVAPQLTCFWKIFGAAAVVLWIILAFWIGAFTGITHALLERFGLFVAAALLPFIWTGLEYFRSELYYLRFSWLSVGYAFSGEPILPHLFGIYGMGFLAALCGSFFLLRGRFSFIGAGLFAAIVFTALPADKPYRTAAQMRLAGVQMEFPSEREIPAALDSLLAKYPNADVPVLSEYTLDGPVPDSLKNWCRQNHRYLVVGGKDPAPNNNFYDTAFVVGPSGEIVFRQGKSVPIQFFKDGLPAPKQELWNSPWGKVGICVCYDLSYTRVVDRLVKMGAQMIIVPTMDVVDWGKRQHQLHALVAPERAAEYGVPIFRVASSGISQAVDSYGVTVATAPIAGEGQTLFATFDLPPRGWVPVDRFLARIAVGITVAALVVLCIWKKGTRRKDLVETGKGQPDVESFVVPPQQESRKHRSSTRRDFSQAAQVPCDGRRSDAFRRICVLIGHLAAAEDGRSPAQGLNARDLSGNFHPAALLRFAEEREKAGISRANPSRVLGSVTQPFQGWKQFWEWFPGVAPCIPPQPRAECWNPFGVHAE